MSLSVQDLTDTLTDYGYSIYVPRRQYLEKLVDLPSGGDTLDVLCVHSNSSKRVGNSC